LPLLTLAGVAGEQRSLECAVEGGDAGAAGGNETVVAAAAIGVADDALAAGDGVDADVAEAVVVDAVLAPAVDDVVVVVVVVAAAVLVVFVAAALALDFVVVVVVAAAAAAAGQSVALGQGPVWECSPH
jgi:hypothetical protein